MVLRCRVHGDAILGSGNLVVEKVCNGSATAEGTWNLKISCVGVSMFRAKR
jgi:hypothetical protein